MVRQVACWLAEFCEFVSMRLPHQIHKQATAGVQGLKVNLPRASKEAPNLGVPKTQAITISNEGKMFLNTIPVSKEELETRLNQLKTQIPDLPVVVRGDRATQYQVIMDVLEVVGRAGVTQIGLATQPAK